MNLLDCLLVASTLVAGLWWALSRHRRPTDLQRLSVAALVLALATFAFDGPRWQMIPWQSLAFSVAAAAALRRWRPGKSQRSLRIIGRGALGAGLTVGGLALLTAFVPSLPKPSGAHQVGSEIFRWTDGTRAETLTPNPSDHRQVIAQAWYPADTSKGRPVPYFEAQDKLPGSIGGLPSFMYASFGEIATHATFNVPVSSDQVAWPVLVFSPGLSIPREAYTALSTDLASRGYVVIALSTPYESAPTVLTGGRVIGQTAHPDVMGPPPHPALERLIDMRAADSSFVLDRLAALAAADPSSPLAGHLDLGRVGIVGHSLGGATAVQAMASDDRFKVGVNLDGKLFGSQPDAHLRRPLLWIQSHGAKTAEYAQGRDRLLDRLGDSGSLVTVGGSVHMSFSDDPAYWTSAGRSLVGSVAGAGSISVADMTAMTGDTIAAFVASAWSGWRVDDESGPRPPPGDPCRASRLSGGGLMAGPVEPRSSCSPGEITELRVEARRELKALLVFSEVAGSLIIAIGIWRGPGALWPVWGTIGTTLVIALALGMWATYIRGWQTRRTHQRRAATSSDRRERVGVQSDNI